ncbi:MAG: SPOR domain-containing protein [Pseudomonadota bacterium]
MARSEDPVMYAQQWSDGQAAPQATPHTPSQFEQPVSGHPYPQNYAAQGYDPAHAQPTHAQPNDPYAQPARPQQYAPQSYETYASQTPAAPDVSPPAYPHQAYAPHHTQTAGYAQAQQPSPQPVAYQYDEPTQPQTQPPQYQPSYAPQSGQADAVSADAVSQAAHAGYPQGYADAPTQPAAYTYDAQPDAQPDTPHYGHAPAQYGAEPSAPSAPFTYADGHEQPTAPAYGHDFPPAAVADPVTSSGAAPISHEPTRAPEPGLVSYGHYDPASQTPHAGYAAPVASPAENLGAVNVFETDGGSQFPGMTQPTGHEPFAAGDGFLDHSPITTSGEALPPAARADFGNSYENMPRGDGLTDGGFPAPTSDASFDRRFEAQSQGYDARFEPGLSDPTIQPGGYDQGGQLPQYDPNTFDGAHADTGQQPYPGEDFHADHEDPAFAPVIADQQAPTSGGRRGLIVVGALVAAVGIGGALGFAYKYSNESSTRIASAPPTIKANKSPTKEKPTQQSGGQNAVQGEGLTSLSSNRAAGGSRTRVIPREESLANTLRRSTNGQTSSGTPRVTALQNGGSSRVNVPGVRQVKTRAVRPDGTLVTPASAQRPGEVSIPGITLGDLQPATQNRAKTVAQRVTAPATTQNRAAAAVKRAARLPQRAVPQPSAATQRQRVASLQPTAPTPAPTPAPATTSNPGLGFVVQVSARRSRIDALAAFADLQQRYTSALSTKQPDIQEVNLGSRGKWYRVRIGPPGSKNAAYNLCNRLKKSGLKDCIIKAY